LFKIKLLGGVIKPIIKMSIFKSEPMVKSSNQVHTTTDYFLFKSIDGNRNKNLLHINRLRESMSKNYLFTVIIVNENYEIIDGQHRFDVIQELKLPLNYIVCKGYGLKEVHVP
jgi:ParB-like chromosome segregation protein Spo0J